MKVNLFKIALLKNEKTLADIAELLELSPSTIYRKMHGDSDFYRHEIILIKNFLKLTDEECNEIFLT